MAWADAFGTLQGHLGDQRQRMTAWDAAPVRLPKLPETFQGNEASGFEPARYGADAFEGWGDGPAMSTSGSPVGGMMGLGGLPNSTTLAQAMDMNPGLARGVMTGLGMMNPALGMGLMGLNAVGNIGNTMSNVDMLHGLGVQPGWGSILGGAFGFNNLAGNPTGALNKAMADMMPGFANLSSAQMPGDFTTGGWGGWADIAAGMGPTAGSAPSSSRDGIQVEQLGPL